MLRKTLKFVRSWALLFSMGAGILGYFIYAAIPGLAPTRPYALAAVEFLQPLLIFVMLFLTFCKVNPRHLRMRPWYWALLGVQGGVFALLGLLVMQLPAGGLRIVLEGAMICFICPVATAAAVVTRRLGGSPSHITTYTILCNLMVAVMIPVMVPLVHPHPGLSVFNAMMLILGKVFPLLLLPLFLAFLVRWLSPKLHFALTRLRDLPFRLWVVALFLAIAVTMRYIMHSHLTLLTGLGLLAAALVGCLAQFAIGWAVGDRYGERTTAGQALGQKNTVFAIWIGYTFFTPVTSVVGGFYSLFHNIVNSIQLHSAAKKDAKKLAQVKKTL